MNSYINILRQNKIPHHSVNLRYDITTSKKICIPPPGWQKLIFSNSVYNPYQNAIIQITGATANIIIIDIDGTEHPTNKLISELCLSVCKFYNRTRKGYHFFFKYSDRLAQSHNIKYADDNTNSGIDILSNGRCAYFGSYKIGSQLITYDNITHEAIIDIPSTLYKELESIINKSGKFEINQRKTKKYPNHITRTDFPEQVSIDIPTLDQLIACFPIKCFESYDQWLRMAFIIKQSNHSLLALTLFHKYSAKASKYSNITLKECTDKWNSIPYAPSYIFQETLFLARKYNPKLFTTIKLPWFNPPSKLYQAIQFHSQYLEYKYLQPLYQQNKILAIASPYGTGKTQFLSKLFSNTIVNENTTRILFITARVSLSYSTLQSFPTFKHYQLLDANSNKEEFSNIQQLIIQLDSLYKLDPSRRNHKLTLGNNNESIFTQLFPNCKDKSLISNNSVINQINTFDIIALDEIESLLYHISFQELATQYIFDILTKLCKSAKKIIALDGDISDRAFIFLSSIQEYIPSNLLILNNTFQTTSKHYIFTNCNKTFDKQLDEDLISGKNCILICMTLKASEHYYNKYKDSYSTIIHNSIQNDKQILSNINNEWKVRLVIYTSTIETGCDFNQQWFHKCHIVLSNMATIPRALMQMCNRVRHFADNTVNVFTNGIPFNEFAVPYQYEEICNKMSSLINKPVSEFNTLDKILAYNECETMNKQYFISVFCDLLRKKGHTYEYRKVQKIKKQKLITYIHQDIANADSISSPLDYKAIIELIRTPTISGKQMRECYCAIKKYLISKLWNIDIDTIVIDDVKRYYPKISKLINYKFFIRFIQQRNITWKIAKLSKKIHHIQYILSLFGITHQDDFEFSIDCGASPDGRKLNSKRNPFLISTMQYKNIANILKPLILDSDFRFVFDLGKTENTLSDRQILETIKKIISQFGFVLEVFRKSVKQINETNNEDIFHENTYLIDLDISLIELFNQDTRYYFDEIQDEDVDKFVDMTADDFLIEDDDSDEVIISDDDYNIV